MVKKIFALIFLLQFNHFSFSQNTLSKFLHEDITDNLIRANDSLLNKLEDMNKLLRHQKSMYSDRVANEKEAMDYVWFLQKLENNERNKFTQTDSTYIDSIRYSQNKIEYIKFAVPEKYLPVLLDSMKTGGDLQLNDSIHLQMLFLHFPRLSNLINQNKIQAYVSIEPLKLQSTAPEIQLMPPVITGTSTQAKKRMLEEQLNYIQLKSKQNGCPENLLNDYMKEEAKIAATDLDKKIANRKKFIAYILTNCHK